MQGRTAVFDLDGTLADTSGDLLAAANACFRQMGHGDVLGPQDALVAFAGGRAMLRLGLSRVRHNWSDVDVDTHYPALLAAYAADIDRLTAVYPGVPDALAALSAAGWLLGICTNKPEALAAVLLTRLGLRHHFGSLIGADTLPVRKPDPLPYHEAVRRLGGSPARSVLIGDTITDRDTARAAGVPVVLVGFGPMGAGVAALQPDRVLPHYDALPAVLAGLLPD